MRVSTALAEQASACGQSGQESSSKQQERPSGGVCAPTTPAAVATGPHPLTTQGKALMGPSSTLKRAREVKTTCRGAEAMDVSKRR